MTAQRINGLSEIAPQYDAFLLDQYGVLHDGERLYPGVADTMAKLAAAGKTLVVMTNSGKRAKANRNRLAHIGLSLDPLQVVSSGEVAYQSIADGRLGEPFFRRRKAFIIGKRDDDYQFEGLELAFVSAPDEADFLLILGTNVPEWNIEDYRTFLKAAAEKRVPALCCNPDFEMLTPAGVLPAPGAIAQTYEKLGGEVIYIGKPQRAIYDYAIAMSGGPERGRVLAVGDSILHDIVGAKVAGIAVALVLTGLSLGLSDAGIARQSGAAGAKPDWILPSLAW